MKKFISIIFVFLISQYAFAEPYTFTAEVLLIEKDYIVIHPNLKKFKLVNKYSPAYTRLGSSFKTSYIDGGKTTFESLAKVGYISKAKITIEDNLVKEIIVLEMQQ